MKHTRRWILLFIIIGCFGIVGATCAIPVEEERAIGDEFRVKVLQELTLVQDPVVTGYVRSLGSRFVSAGGPQPFIYTFDVVQDNELNAFAGPGGQVYVNSGLILKAKKMNEVGGVVAHEIAHVMRRHVAQQIGQQQTILSIGELIFGDNQNPWVTGTTEVGATLLLLNYSRRAETEADQLAVNLMIRAGVDPNGLVGFLRVIQAESAGSPQPPKILSSHPLTDERILAVKAEIAKYPATEGLAVSDAELKGVQSRLRRSALAPAPFRRGTQAGQRAWRPYPPRR